MFYSTKISPLSQSSLIEIYYFVASKVLLFAELGYSLSRSPWQHKYGTNNKKEAYYANPIYSPVKNSPVVSVGLAYRVRFDIEKKKEEIIN